MTKYTAEDFANAKFAEHPDGTLAARFYDGGLPEDEPGDDRAWESPGDYHTDQDMSRFGWVPVPTKPTITESEYRKGIGSFSAFNKAGFDSALRIAGVEVIPDTEPTNTERTAEAVQMNVRPNRNNPFRTVKDN